MTYEKFWMIFSWATAINLGIYIFSALMIVFFRDWMIRIQGRMMGFERDEMVRLYGNFLAAHKLLLSVFFVGPWIAMWIVG